MTQTRSVEDQTAGGGPRFVIIGGGMAGILSAIQLQEAGFDNVTIYEKADRLGGTWRENTYPGVACDVPSHFYSYSFALNSEWSHRFAPGAEILKYFEDVAGRYGIEARVRFGKEVNACVLEDGSWRLRTTDGHADRADFVLAATGVLHHPAYPDIAGVADFRGPTFHSARWDHSVDLAGKRVGVVGTGSSAVQIVSALVKEVGELVLFQRTPQWIAPVDNAAYTEEEKATFRAHPEAMWEIRDAVAESFTAGFANILVDAESPLLQSIQDGCAYNLESNVADPVLREKLRPAYRAACKRLVLSPDFYASIQRSNARLVTDRIERVEADGVRTADGKRHEIDVLVFATGFQVNRFVRPMRVVGRAGRVLDDAWEDGPYAYQSIAVPSFPNFFFLNGPNSPVGNFSLIDVAERQFAYILKLVAAVDAAGRRHICPTEAAMQSFEARRKEAARSTIWNSGCRSWYLDKEGLPTAWPWTYDKFREEMASPRFEDFELFS